MNQDKDKTLSGVQALEYYFHALLDCNDEDDIDGEEAVYHEIGPEKVAIDNDIVVDDIAVDDSAVVREQSTMISAIDCTPIAEKVIDEKPSFVPEPSWLTKQLSPTSQPLLDAPLLLPNNKESAVTLVKTVKVDELPDLGEVQRLLNQLESSNQQSVFPELEKVMEQNTLQLNKVNRSPDPVVTTAVTTKTTVTKATNIVATATTEQPTSQTAPVIEKVVSQQQKASSTVTKLAPVSSRVEIVQPTVKSPINVEMQCNIDENLVAWKSAERDTRFQVLYFEVNNITFAVPLDKLGGIHRLTQLNHLIGRPNWYLGLQSTKNLQLNVVDSAIWMMSDKVTNDDYRKQYQYIVLLNDSLWGLACTKLIGTEWLSNDNIRWRTQPGKRPWLAGIIKEKMCVLIHIDAMVGMLNADLNLKTLEQ